VNDVDTDSKPDTYKAESTSARAEGISTISRVRTAVLGDTINITNSLEYAPIVEHGSVHNPPHHMAERAYQDIQVYVKLRGRP
jgi:hypothetical protein